MQDDPDLDEMEATTERNRGMPMPIPKKAKKKPPVLKNQPPADDNPFEGGAPVKKAGPPAPPKGGGGHPGIAIIISPLANHAEDHRSSVRNSIEKSLKQVKRRK